MEWRVLASVNERKGGLRFGGERRGDNLLSRNRFIALFCDLLGRHW